MLYQTFCLLLSIPGLGEKTVLTLLGEYGVGLSQANPKQLTRYAGLDVILFESGESVRTTSSANRATGESVAPCLWPLWLPSATIPSFALTTEDSCIEAWPK